MILLHDTAQGVVREFSDPAVRFILYGALAIIAALGTTIVFLVKYIITTVRTERRMAQEEKQQYIQLLISNRESLQALVGRIEVSDATFASDIRQLKDCCEDVKRSKK